jgi:hypothetical protein
MTGTQNESGKPIELAARLLWFRTDHPESDIESHLVVSQDSLAVCRVTLRTTSVGSVSSHGSAWLTEDGAAYVEVAEDRALSRALDVLGYASAHAEDVDDQNQDEETVPIDLVSARSLLREESAAEPYDENAQKPHPIRETPELESEPQSTEDSGADVNWNKFWTWARMRGYKTAKELNELLGVDNVLAYTPREVRQMLVKYELENPPGGQDE